MALRVGGGMDAVDAARCRSRRGGISTSPPERVLHELVSRPLEGSATHLASWMSSAAVRSACASTTVRGVVDVAPQGCPACDSTTVHVRAASRLRTSSGTLRHRELRH